MFFDSKEAMRLLFLTSSGVKEKGGGRVSFVTAILGVYYLEQVGITR